MSAVDTPRYLQSIAACFATAVLLAACASSSNPFGSASDTDITFLNAAQTWDINKDNVTTCDEWKQYSSALLRQADGDGDSALTLQEWPSLAKQDRLFDVADHAYYDGNKDGKVSADELTGTQNAAFRMLDKNNDCQITHEEKAHVYNVAKPKPKDSFHDPSAGGGGVGGR
jgi:hypothetical protein